MAESVLGANTDRYVPQTYVAFTGLSLASRKLAGVPFVMKQPCLEEALFLVPRSRGAVYAQCAGLATRCLAAAVF